MPEGRYGWWYFEREDDSGHGLSDMRRLARRQMRLQNLPPRRTWRSKTRYSMEEYPCYVSRMRTGVDADFAQSTGICSC